MSAPTYSTGDGTGIAAWDLAHARCAPADVIRNEWLRQKLRGEKIERDEQEPCSAEGCDKDAACAGLCHAHYKAEWRRRHPKQTEPKEKAARCKRGHLFDATRISGGVVYRVCRECRRMRERKQRAAQRAERAGPTANGNRPPRPDRPSAPPGRRPDADRAATGQPGAFP